MVIREGVEEGGGREEGGGERRGERNGATQKQQSDYYKLLKSVYPRIWENKHDNKI